MKNVILIALFLILSGSCLFAQERSLPVQQGDIFTIHKPSDGNFNHIAFPRPNFIIKRGGLANMKSVSGLEVVVTSVGNDRFGGTEITLERADGQKFFRSFRKVTANFEKALQAGELNR